MVLFYYENYAIVSDNGTIKKMFLGTVLSSVIFLFGYALITIEHKIGTHKSAIALSLAGILWFIVALSLPDKNHLSHAAAEAGTEVFNVIAFLLAAMSLVEILIHYKFFDMIRFKLSALRLNDQRQFLVISILTFFFRQLLTI